jgi:hypothetical protein
MERLEDAESLDATAEALWEVLPDWVVTGWGRQLLVASLPTAAAGLSDWSRREKRDRRVGVVHAHDARRDTGQPAARCAGEPFLITTTP